MGSTYVNDFIDKGRVKKVFMQGDAPFRMQPEDIDRWYLRNAMPARLRTPRIRRNAQFQSLATMVPLSAFSSAEWRLGSPKLERFNGTSVRRAPRRSRARPQHRRGDARSREDGARRCLPGMGIEWAGLVL